MSTSMRCRVGWHKWIKRFNDEGLRYLACSRCGKEDHGTFPLIG